MSEGKCGIKSKKQETWRDMRNPEATTRPCARGAPTRTTKKILLLNVKDLMLDRRKVAALKQELKVMGVDVNEVHRHVTLHQLAKVVVLTKSIATGALPLSGLGDTMNRNTCVAEAEKVADCEGTLGAKVMKMRTTNGGCSIVRRRDFAKGIMNENAVRGHHAVGGPCGRGRTVRSKSGVENHVNQEYECKKKEYYHTTK